MYTLEDFFDLLKKLEREKIYYKLSRNKEKESIVLSIVVPGQRWEIGLFSNGSIEIEKFFTTINISDEKGLDDLVKQIEL